MTDLDQSAARQAFENGIRSAAIATGMFEERQLDFENVATDNPGPGLRLEVELVDAVPENLLLDGTLMSEVGSYQLIVVSPKNKGQTDARSAARMLKGELQVNKSFPISTGGVVYVRSVPQVIPGYPDDTSWRIPLVVQYRAAV